MQVSHIGSTRGKCKKKVERGYPRGGYKGGRGSGQGGRSNNSNVVNQKNGGNASVPSPVEGGDSPPEPTIGKPEVGRGEVPLRAEQNQPGHRWVVPLHCRRGTCTTHHTPIASHKRPQTRRQMEGRGKNEWWCVGKAMWPRQDVGKGQGRGVSQPVWMPAQNAD
jgi:hypothetical protein